MCHSQSRAFQHSSDFRSGKDPVPPSEPFDGTVADKNRLRLQAAFLGEITMILEEHNVIQLKPLPRGNLRQQRLRSGGRVHDKSSVGLQCPCHTGHESGHVRVWEVAKGVTEAIRAVKLGLIPQLAHVGMNKLRRELLLLGRGNTRAKELL